MKERLTRLMSEYGPIALGVYLSTSVVTFAGAAIAISRGMEVSGAAEGAGVAAASWVVLKISQPVRLLATVALTPVVARFVRRTPPSDAPPSDALPSDAPPSDAPSSDATPPSDAPAPSDNAKD